MIPAPIAPLDVDLAGERLLAEITCACDRSTVFAEQVEAALGAALDLFSAQSDLVRLLCDGSVSRPVACRQISWQEIFAARLRNAAKRQPQLSTAPLLLEQVLVAGIQSHLRHWLLDGQRQPLRAQLPALLEFILAYYPEASVARNGQRVAHD